MIPEERIAEVRSRSPRGLELAHFLSLASRISPSLLRRFRLEFLRRSGPELEAELWLSPLVEIRGPREILFFPEIAAFLRKELALVPAQLQEARDLLVRTQPYRPALVRLEEDLIWLGHHRGKAGTAEDLTTQLRSLVKSVLEEDRKGLGRWALAFLRRVPELEDVPASLLLRAVSERSLFDGRITLEPGTAFRLPAEDRNLLLGSVERVQAGVRFANGQIGVREPPQGDDQIIELPATRPRCLEVHWEGGGSPHKAILSWEPEQRNFERLSVTPPVTLLSLSWDRYEIASQEESAQALAAAAGKFLVGVAGLGGSTLESVSPAPAAGPGWLISRRYALTAWRWIASETSSRKFDTSSHPSIHLRFPWLGITVAARVVDVRPWPERFPNQNDGIALLEIPETFPEDAEAAPEGDLPDQPGSGAAVGFLPGPPVPERTLWGHFLVRPSAGGGLDLSFSSYGMYEHLEAWCGSPLIQPRTGKVLGLILSTLDSVACISWPELRQIFPALSGAKRQETKNRFNLGRLPVPGPVFVGREQELARLDAALEDPETRIISLVGLGGVGKSTLVARWLDRLAAEGWRGMERAFDWSFYSQGTGERIVSAENFLTSALRFFGDSDPIAGSPFDRGVRLAELVRRQRTLLLLDGVEPLQYAPGPLEGRLRDPALAGLLRSLAVTNPGLCVITSRQRIAELDAFPKSAVQLNLEQLPIETGAELLRHLGVVGSPSELQDAAQELDSHPLLLTLLGTYLRRAHGGDVRRRSEVNLAEANRGQGGHAFRVMAAYENWLGEGTELALLRLMGLFDRPATGEELRALRARPVITGLTDLLVNLSDEEWESAVTSLREYGLLEAGGARASQTLDAHPLVRAYFSDELRNHRLEAWRQGNRRLYEHLRNAAPEYPETVEEMTPLFAAILHGCRAERHREALNDVYLRRILRGEERYSSRRLGAVHFELSALASFFDSPWGRLSDNLLDSEQAFVLNEAGHHLRSLGRLEEAFQPLQASFERSIARESWRDAAISASNLGEVALALGEVARAIELGRQGIELANRSGDIHLRLPAFTVLTHALHQAGRWDESQLEFRQALALLSIPDNWNPLLEYRYCDFLLSYSEPEDGSSLEKPTVGGESASSIERACEEVLGREGARAETRRLRRVRLAESGPQPLDIALSHLALGRANLGLYRVRLAGPAPSGLHNASDHLDRAVDGLRRANAEDLLPHGLLARAALRRFRGDVGGAASDLDEALAIAEQAAMRLHACDAHLERTRLLLHQGKAEEAPRPLAHARALVAETGYLRRAREVSYLEEVLQQRESLAAFFISYHPSDLPWAEWIAWTLEAAGYPAIMGAWDFVLGTNFVLEMQRAVSKSRRTILVLSKSYLESAFTTREWEEALLQDIGGRKRRLLAIRVDEVTPRGLIANLVYADLVGRPEKEARKTLLDAVAERSRPASPLFPGWSTEARAYPGIEEQGLSQWKEKLAFLLEHEAISADPSQRFALRKQIQEAEQKIRELRGLG